MLFIGAVIVMVRRVHVRQIVVMGFAVEVVCVGVFVSHHIQPKMHHMQPILFKRLQCFCVNMKRIPICVPGLNPGKL
jgi:hypothetical protein